MSRYDVRTAPLFRKVLRHPVLEPFLENHPDAEGLIRCGWGLKPSGRSARKAAAFGGRLLLLEDAFVRSLKPGSGGALYGLLADSKGVHYDAAGPSDLITALETGTPSGWMRNEPIDSATTSAMIERFKRLGVSKYNWFPGEYRESVPDFEPGILVVDQTRGDTAIRRGGIPEDGFARMLRDAFDLAAGRPVYLRAHPDHLHRAKRSCFPAALLNDSRLKLLPPDLSPARCFRFCETVMVGGSLLGMEALLHGCKVITYGRPFFAGWGLTEDRTPAAKPRSRTLDLATLFEHAYLRYCHYFDPDTKEPCGLDTILDHLERQFDTFRANRGKTITYGLTPWNRRIATAYFRSPGGNVEHCASPEELTTKPRTDRVVLWGRKLPAPDGCADVSLRIEDGFLRSRGLGAAFNYPFSWVVDHSGIYFDSTGPSDLETMLNTADFSEAEKHEAQCLIDTLLELRLTKYNLPTQDVTLDPAIVRGRKVILAPGQVEADASIAYGSHELKSNLALLRKIRAAEPDAFLLFKAHPDLVAATRHGNVLPPGYAETCDLAVTHGNIIDWLDLADEVHTMTSTVGFEALLRNKPVVTHGMPFYGGWGLTKDSLTCPRRTRRLTLVELVCGCLIRYPRYLNPITGEFTTASKVATLLTRPDSKPTQGIELRTLSAVKRFWISALRNRKS
jgi:capsular polysaccharide export protein